MNYLILLCSLIAFEASGTILHQWVYNQATTGTSPVPDSKNPNNENYKMTLLRGAKITSEGLQCSGGYGETAGNIPAYGTISHTLEARVKLTGVAWGVSPVALDSDYNPTTGAYRHRQFDAIVNNENANDNKWIAGSDYFRRTKKPMTGNGVVAESLNEWIHIMISYNVEHNLVTIYRNGEQYGDSYRPAGGFMNINEQVRALACVRASKPTFNTASLIGTIAYARIHKGAKTPADVRPPTTPTSGTILHKWVYNQATTGTSPVPDSINPNNVNYKMTLLEGARITSEGLSCSGGYGKTAGSIPQYGTISHTLEARVKFTGNVFAWGSSPLALDSNYNPTNGHYGHRQFDAIVNNENSNDNKWIAGSDYFRRTKKPMTGNGVVAESLNEWIHIMISYNVEHNLVTIYRNGEQYGDSYPPAGGFMNINDQVRAMACIRHLRTASLIGTIAYAAIHEGAKTPADVTNDEWIEIASEAVGNDGTDKWRYLDFGSEIYAEHPEITEYKLEWGANYENVVVFELGGAHSNHHIFENTPESVNPNIKINILESNVQGLPVATDQYFCKACASSYGTKPGDTCWGILDKSDTNRQCGCNSGGWRGNGAYYGGWIPGQCNQCICWGGAFTGYKGNGQQKGTISSVGLRLSIKVPYIGSGAYSKPGLFLENLSSDSSGISMYWMYTIAILLFINVICFAVYWCKCGKSSHQYKVVSVDSN